MLESKSGRQAILAKTIIDASGDGDLFASAGAEYERRSHNVGLVSRVGNIDKLDPSQAKGDPKPKHLGQPTPVGGHSSAFAVDIIHPAWLSSSR